MSAQGVFTPEYRFKFVKGSLTEGTETILPTEPGAVVKCGSGTYYPLLVTIEELAEMFYRVKDAWFTEGEVNISYTAGEDTVTGTMTVLGGAPPDELVSSPTGFYFWRGYHKLESFVGAGEAPYFQAAYTVNSTDYQDVDDNERVMWLPFFNELDGDFYASAAFSPNALGFTTYMSADLSGASVPSHGIESTSSDSALVTGVELALMFSFNVAWIDDNESGNPFDPLNSLYVGLLFQMQGLGGYVRVSTRRAAPLETTAGIQLVFEMVSGSPACDLYRDDGEDVTSVSGSDLVIAAQKWWPYAKENPAEPVWDDSSGAKLP